MFTNFRKAAIAGLILGAFSSAFGIAGVGVHYGIDLSLKMDDKLNDAAVFDNLKLNVSSFTGTTPAGYTATTISGADLPIFVSRVDWQRTVLNLGGKVYVDVIPFIDAIEISSNFGLWEYKGSIKYPTSIEFKPQNEQPTELNAPFINRVKPVVYDSTSLTLKDLGLPNFWIIQNTPYAKLQLDATIRKNIFKLPLNIFKLYGGGGFSVNLSTPAISSKLIEDAIGTQLNKAFDVPALGTNVLGNVDVMQKVGKEIIAQMFTPHFGVHLDVGAMVKIPVVPIGFYVDGKFLIPLAKQDASVDVGGLGFLINAGVALAF